MATAPGLCCSLLIPPPSFFLYISILFTSFFLITLLPTPTPPSFHRRCHRRLPHESCDWASCTSLSLGSTSMLATTSLQFPPQPQLGFLSLFFLSLPFSLLYRTLSSLLFTAHPSLHSSLPSVGLLCRLQSLRRCTHHPSQCTNSQRADSVGS